MTQAQQPEALRIAMHLRSRAQISSALGNLDTLSASAANELERQHARILELEQGKCLHHIAEPAQTARPAFEAISQFMKCEWSLDWDKAGFYSDVKVDAAFTWFEKGYMRAQHAAAPQAVQPAVHVAHRHKFTDGHRTLKQDVFSAIHDYSATKPEQDHDDSESWESWFEAAFDLLGTRVGQIFEEHAERDAAAPAHPAEGVPAMAAPFAEVLTDEDMEDFVSTHGFTGDFESMARIVEEKVLEKVAATQPTAQGMEADLADEQIDETFNQMPDGAAGFLKSWGYRQFARAVLAAQAKQGGAA